MCFRPDFFIPFSMAYHFGTIKKVVHLLLCDMVKQERNISFLRAVARRIRQVREERGLPQEKMQFEKRIFLAHIENDERNISVTMLLDICRAYGITLADFFRGMEPYEGAIITSDPRITEALKKEEENDEETI